MAITLDSLVICDSTKTINIYPSEAFCSQIFTSELLNDIHAEIKTKLPSTLNYNCQLLDKRSRKLEELIPAYLCKNTSATNRKWGEIDYKGAPWVSFPDRPYSIKNGLQGRHIFLWPSHGRYYKNAEGRWSWQRPFLFCTTEDIFTQSIVNPYLIPMLENAGAIVGTPRERDVQTAQSIVDNDTPETDGKYVETSNGETKWENCSTPAFSNIEKLLTDNSLSPFTSGTARQIATTSENEPTACAIWFPNIKKHGNYAVYVSYVTLPESVEDAHYEIHHLGGKTNVRVNQKMGGGTWVYLGTYAFSEGQNDKSCVILTNQSSNSGIVTADAVRFGGGMGRTDRNYAGSSQLPSFAEGARYYAQWAGVPDSLYNTEYGTNDYNDDIRSRSNMLNFLGGGSPFMPNTEGRGVPFELALAVHSDAGVRYDKSIYGTLAISTTVDGQGFDTYESGISRMASYDFAQMIAETVTKQLSKQFNMTWTRREVWDRNYGETRSPHVPSVILETMSHQNFNDMRYGHDPLFKFAMARSIYKGILQYINFAHGKEHCVTQPLPVSNFAATFTADGKSAQLSWLPTEDDTDTSAMPDAYMVFQRIDNGGYDNGTLIKDRKAIIPLTPGKTYSFYVCAINSGGMSFPSETLSIRRQDNVNGNTARVLIVNGYDRISGPAFIETNDSLGFLLDYDYGVPYLYTTAFTGNQLNFNRNGIGKEGPSGLGYSDHNLQGHKIAGNSFDYPVVHGDALATAGVSFASCSRDAFCKLSYKDLQQFDIIDYIAGLQERNNYNLRDFKTFNKETREKIKEFIGLGDKALLVSGAHIGKDMQESDEEKHFCQNVLGFNWEGTTGFTPTNKDDYNTEFNSALQNTSNGTITGLGTQFTIQRELSDSMYAVINADIINPLSLDNSFSAFSWSNGYSAGTAWNSGSHRVISMAFPFESIQSQNMRQKAMRALVRYLLGKE